MSNTLSDADIDFLNKFKKPNVPHITNDTPAREILSSTEEVDESRHRRDILHRDTITKKLAAAVEDEEREGAGGTTYAYFGQADYQYQENRCRASILYKPKHYRRCTNTHIVDAEDGNCGNHGEDVIAFPQHAADRYDDDGYYTVLATATPDDVKCLTDETEQTLKTGTASACKLFAKLHDITVEREENARRAKLQGGDEHLAHRLSITADTTKKVFAAIEQIKANYMGDGVV